MDTARKGPGEASPVATLFIVSAAQFLAPFMMSAVGVALPTIGRFYAASAVSLGLVEMVYILAVALFLLPAGRIADIHGRKKVFITGVALFTMATAMLPFAGSIEMFIGFRFFQGIGASLNISTSIAILSAVFPKHRRGRAMGIIVAAVYLGLSAGPTLAGLMIAHLGWQSIFLVAAPLALAVLVLAVKRLKGEWKGAEGAAFDYAGSLIYMLSLFCLILGVSHLKEGGGHDHHHPAAGTVYGKGRSKRRHGAQISPDHTGFVIFALLSLIGIGFSAVRVSGPSSKKT